MAKIGRNDPCYCGSGKKYKHCHRPIDEQQEAERRLLRQAQDSLLPKLIEVAQVPEVAAAAPLALERFWNGKYQVSDMAELDEREDRGADRFLTWFAFSYIHDDGRTLVERIAADPDGIELDEYERRLLNLWTGVRLRPYIIKEIKKGHGFIVADLLTGAEYEVEDHAASKRVEIGEVVITHLVPAAERYYIAGAAAHLTPDTQEKLREFVGMHREAFAGDDESFVQANSHLFNHFVMALPREEGEPSKVDELLMQGRISLQMAAASLGLHRDDDKSEEPTDVDR